MIKGFIDFPVKEVPMDNDQLAMLIQHCTAPLYRRIQIIQGTAVNLERVAAFTNLSGDPIGYYNPQTKTVTLVYAKTNWGDGNFVGIEITTTDADQAKIRCFNSCDRVIHTADTVGDIVRCLNNLQIDFANQVWKSKRPQ